MMLAEEDKLAEEEIAPPEEIQIVLAALTGQKGEEANQRKIPPLGEEYPMIRVRSNRNVNA